MVAETSIATLNFPISSNPISITSISANPFRQLESSKKRKF